MTTDCVIVQPIARPGVELLKRAGLSIFEAPSTDLETLRPHLSSARAAITRNEGLSADAIAAAPNLAIIASHGTGTDRIAMDAAAARGIRVVNTPGSNARSVAEHALGLILACARQIPAADRAVRCGDWAIRERAQPVEISDRTLGLVGFGHVARHLARMARGLGMPVLCHSSHASEEELADVGVLPAKGLDNLLRAADILSLHGRMPGGVVLEARHIACLRPGAILVNTARGALIDEGALVNALHEGQIAAAALDVFEKEPLAKDSPLLGCPNLILTPHMGGAASEARDRTSVEVAKKVVEGLGLPVPD